MSAGTQVWVRDLFGDAVASALFKQGRTAARQVAGAQYPANTPRRTVTSTAVDLTLAADDNDTVIVVTVAKTVTVPAIATLGEGFSCVIIADGVAVTVDGPGGTNISMSSGDVALLFAAGAKIRGIKVAGTVIT
jgi:hypothetical protein